ncbi:Na+/H+ antiporter [Kutzneria buriramensis]|uniref:CPA1 family monovalent cation:H+ antiporter n=1 Tax=Kutzneria buriramensis TaxID=1045776 RepID=A0A3E0G6Q5_9PSEU|nr:Na+/H+ antiporter [Kutzneria buriramensis]REH17890.1 CPA1 family monovalent cation:H+ antiporter [Kutzneria buriramensis]
MLGLELVVLLGVAVLVGRVAGDRLGVAPPIVLLAAGAALGFVPALRAVHLPPELVLLLFLPALLYWESLTTSLREIRANLRGIVLLATVLVIATASAVAVVAHVLGLPWGPAWVLGAAVAPTDATATEVVARLLPRRQVTVLRAESLVNDGTALVIYGLAVGVTVGQDQLSLPHVGWLFLLAYAGGAAAGAVTGWVAAQVRRRQTDPLTGQVTMLLIPFTAFLLAEAVNASGVLAVVVSGLIMSQAAPRVVRAEMRVQAQAFWTVATFLLNAALFVLVGLELQSAVRDLDGAALPRALVLVVIVTAVVIVARLVFLFTVPYLVRVFDRRPPQRPRPVDHRPRLVSAFAGFRGAVSLAAALAVPQQLASGAPFPNRDMIVFVTGGVIVLTLLQGLLLPGMVRWARLPPDTAVAVERQLAETRATEDALRALPQLAADLGTAPDVVDRLNRELDERLQVLRAHGDGAVDHPAVRHDEHYTALYQALIAHKRATVVRLRDERHIDDTVLRQVQAALDIEEVRLSQREAAE